MFILRIYSLLTSQIYKIRGKSGRMSGFFPLKETPNVLTASYWKFSLVTAKHGSLNVSNLNIFFSNGKKRSKFPRVNAYLSE